ncbi:MAG: fluoride efflux transporter CrcB [Prevotella sp.]|nr:fluoride efflux transporter CrcB [Candidatus Equicola faecalis]
MRELLCVFVGGGIGSAIRYLISVIWQHLLLNPQFSNIIFPWPTFIVNIIGCLLIGFFYNYSGRCGMTHEVQLLLTVGLCGGFTTFSTFSYESISLIHSGHVSMCLIYIVGSFLLGIVAACIPNIISHT